ncbi:MAG: ABC transporter ATP-binding protein [Betaproteobacteria bacterium]
MSDLDSVTLADVSRHFGRRRALSHVSLSVRSGELVGLLGPNGAGKSTLIGIVATLVAPTSGEVRYGSNADGARGSGRATSDAVRGRIGLLAHDLYLYPELTARQNLAFFARLYGLDATRTVDAALAAAGLADRGDDDVSAFSRGMRQRLALERALLHGPRLLLLDEPFTGLDDRAVSIVSERLRRLAAAGTIVILATHDLDVADGLVHRVVLIREGRLVSDEPAGPGLRARYRTLVGSA